MSKTEINGAGGAIYEVEIRVTANAKRIRISQKEDGDKKIMKAKYLSNLMKRAQG